MIKIMLVEDDPILARIILYYLQQEGFYEVEWVKTAGEALAIARHPFDVILLDVKLPDVSGIDLCQKLREWHSCPIIFISCLDDSDTIIRALEMGGDDFVTKPFDNKVLAARIHANLRRNRSLPTDQPVNQLICNSFSLDMRSQTVCREGISTPLSNMEFRVLSYLMQNPDRYISAEELYKKVWGKDSCGDVRTVMVHIHNIRKKIGEDKQALHVRCVWGKGYYFDPKGTQEN
ncbi:MAG: response regulator transcription factor [Lachnospiraceae bacterium]|nr:response regulator transcription factor [Lachnospiraceae bacterium]